jgi:hypothetical protein
MKLQRNLARLSICGEKLTTDSLNCAATSSDVNEIIKKGFGRR